MEPPPKRKTSPSLVANPFIKRRNLEWRISPPPLRSADRRRQQSASTPSTHTDGNPSMPEAGEPKTTPAAAAAADAVTAPTSTHTPAPSPPTSTSAAIEAGRLQISDHLTHFLHTLTLALSSRLPSPASLPLLPLPAYGSLFASALGSPRGAHFVVHQHDHPVAGPHYDLRLQINPTSSASWAVMYGLPGDPGAARKKVRNASETRVHCLWNHLVETGSAETGSLVVWDTGTYEVVEPPLLESSQGNDEDEEGVEGEEAGPTQQEKLARAFARRKIRVRLNGARLPRGYVVYLRLTREEDAAGRARADRTTAAAAEGRLRKRRRKKTVAAPETSSSESAGEEDGDSEHYDDGSAKVSAEEAARLSATERELRELEDEEVRRTNAYPGASNTIGSVHQRKWFLSIDREASGLVKRKGEGGKVVWVKEGEDQDASKREDGNGEDNRYQYPFYVRGPEHERSVLTGRLGAEVLQDEGVVGFVGRKGWRPVLG
ncbi:ABC1 domain containing protein [Pleurostoma richardsiae]|uniref:ABC1 domain containing protein n=1 Tax=Pleurostoma richardsiae TaxID=41990 RepID=A0AA38RNI3_9PEZI|nr:ABC1 domain containing protein [Pleurostoma richardsiae]